NWIPAGVPASTDTINFTNGTINLTSSVTIGGSFNWSGGTLSGDPLTIENGGVLNITGSVILQNVLTNLGTVTMTGTGDLDMWNNNSASYKGGVYNLANALWDIQTNATISCYCLGDEFFNNAGIFRKSQGSGTTTISVAFTNTATVTNLSGTLSFNGGGPIAGTYDTAAGATIDFAAGNFTMGALPTISGAGLCEFTGAMLTLNQNVPANLVLAGGTLVLGPAFQNAGAITNFTFSAGTLISTNTVTGTFVWAGGTLTGPLTIENGGVLNITGSVILQNVLTNLGTVTMTGTGDLDMWNNNSASYKGGVYNLANALWDIQ